MTHLPRTLLRTVLSAALISGAGPAFAQTPPPEGAPQVRVGATIFYDYTYTREPRTRDTGGRLVSPNAFNLSRAYLNVTGTLSDVVSFRITPDVTRASATGGNLDGSLVYRLKYGYAQFDLAPWLWPGAEVRAGVIQTAYIDSQESVYRYRFQGTVFAERDGGLSSADAGVSVRGALPAGYGELQLGVYNGEGYAGRETNGQKALQLRATIRPLPEGGVLRGLRVSGFYNGDAYGPDAERRRWILGLLFEHDRFNAGFDFLRGADRTSAALPVRSSQGYSVFVTPFFEEKGRGLEGLLRFDRFDADRERAGWRRRLIAGAAYWLPHRGANGAAALLLDYERVTFPSVLQPDPREQRIAVHGLLSF
jgi:hypothetical protein